MLQGYTIELSDVIGYFSAPCLYYYATSSEFLHFLGKSQKISKRRQIAQKKEPNGYYEVKNLNEEVYNYATVFNLLETSGQY